MIHNLDAVSIILNAPSITEEVQSQFIHLYKMYRDNDPPPISLLRSPTMIDIFVNYLFIPSQSVRQNKDVKKSCVWLFGYSASGEYFFFRFQVSFVIPLKLF